MKDHLLQTVLPASVGNRAQLAREYLQLYLLRLLQTTGAVSHLAFVGGTALRILHRLPRFSEDLDFSLDPPRQAFDAAASFRALARELERAGYRVREKSKTKGSVANTFFRFEGLPHELGVTHDPRVALSIKLEIDQKPPKGGRVETTLVQRFFPVAIRHHDLPSLFAGKLHAILTRRYAKGRDWFDLVWYLTEHPEIEPNPTLLESSLRQTGHDELADVPWPTAVTRRLANLDWKPVLADLRPFVERQSDLEVLSPDLIAPLLQKRR